MSKVPIIFISSASDSMNIIMAMNMGADDFIAKPFDGSVLMAKVLIIYYKQITEGYEDEGRFEIMQKVGMTKRDIRKSINSQMLTVFFLPLVTAALHLSFAFPMVQKLLALFNLRNVTLMLIVMAVTVLVFGVFSALVYKITSNAHFSIVSGSKNE